MKRLLGLLAWISVALVIAAVALRFSGKPDLQPWSQRLALAGLAAIALYALSQWRDIGRSFQGRGVKYGSIAATSVVLVLGILVGLNWVASRQNKRWDLTAGGQFSLSDQTKKILSELKQPVTIRTFYAGNVDQYRDRLAEYSYLSKQISTEFIDVERNPTRAEQFSITSAPTLVLEYSGRTERATSADEQNLTNALKKLLVGTAKKIYFVQGHGEHDPTVSESLGYSGIADALKTDNFAVEKLTLAQTGKVPDDATLLVIAGLKADLLAPEVTAINDFLTRGGKLALLLDPPDKGVGPEATNAIAIAHEWGVDVGRDLVIDASGLGQMIGTDASVPVAMPVQHAITDKFGLMTAFPLARSLTLVAGGVNGHTASKFLETSPQSWAESDLKGVFSTGRPERNLDKGDKAGPVTIAAAVSAPAANVPASTDKDAPKPETRVVVVGDSDFASNRALGIPGNRELFLNMANWLAQQEDLIAIRPKDPENRPITMTADQGNIIFWLTMVGVPIFLFGTGIRVWWKKR